MEYKQFELYNREYRLSRSGVLEVWTLSKNSWVVVSPKKVTTGENVYYRYALWNPNYDWTDDNKKAIVKYEEKIVKFNLRKAELVETGPVGSITTRNLSDIIAPNAPELGKEGDWKRYYVSHGSLVCKYWHQFHQDKDMFVMFLNLVKDNVFDVANWTYGKLNKIRTGGGRKKFPVGVVNTVLSNAGSYSTDYIAEALGLSPVSVTRIILGKGGYDTVGARSQYAMNIRSSRGAFYGIVCYEFESVYDFINRILVHWSNDRRYDEYVSYGERQRNTKGRMGYGLWVQKYGRDERVSKELMKKWIEMNSEFIGDEDAVEELKVYVDNWSVGGERCWGLERYYKYMKANIARMPQKIKVMKGIPCSLRTVGVHTSGSLYDLSDWQLINLFDECMGDFQSLSDSDIRHFLNDRLESEPKWATDYEKNGYETAEAFWESYQSLLGGISVGEFRSSYGDMLRSIPYISTN